MARKSDFRNIQDLFQSLKSERDEHSPLWRSISEQTTIPIDVDNFHAHNRSNKSRQVDEHIDDPTSAIAVNQAGDFMLGVLWGTGEEVFNLKPSRYVKELAGDAELEEWYNFATEQVLFHMNHSKAGLNTSLKPYSYDQFAFGTSGIGTFPNKAFMNGVDHNALLFRPYGVDNIAIDEGKSGLVEYIFVVYNWRVNRIINEFATKDGVIDDMRLGQLPEAIQKAFRKKDYNREFQIVLGVLPRDDFSPRRKGKKGTRYRGVWFMDDPSENKIFREESYKELPIAIARQIKVRNQVYGRAAGTMLLSTIRNVNFIVGTVIEILEKLSRPALGIWGSSIFGDSVLDTSPDGLTVFNKALSGGDSPAFPLHDVGDPTGIINFLIPYLNEKIITAFKIDSLLDFNSQQEMTATESLQRFNIRDKSLAGLLTQQRTELLDPTVIRSTSLLWDMDQLGVNPQKFPDIAQRVGKIRAERVIPNAVLEVVADGRPWFEIEYNNELSRLKRTQGVENLLQLIQTVSAIAVLFPPIIEAVDWHKLLKDANENLDPNSQIIMEADEFKAKLEEMAQANQATQQIAALQGAAQAGKDLTQAQKNQQEANKG